MAIDGVTKLLYFYCLRNLGHLARLITGPLYNCCKQPLNTVYPSTSLPVQGLTTRKIQDRDKNLIKSFKKIEIFYCTVYPSNAEES